MISTPINYPDGSTVVLDFDPKKHYYNVEGKYVPSVTTVLNVIAKPALMPWAVKMGAEWFVKNCEAFEQAELSQEDMVKGIKTAYREVSDDALLVGRMVHDYCEAAINWKLGRCEAPGMPDNEAAESSINAFRAWVRENDVEFISSEEKVYSREHNYAGTIDAVANVNGEFSVVDFKTSARIYNTYYIQCAAYAQCVKEVYGKEIDMSYILRFDKKTGAFEVGKAVETAENFRAFRGFQEGYLRLTEMDNRSKRK
jgi:hypothetical protein|tara:strand:- start:1408 stop:2172 length:765 start_codon:yes stop_codon:yes gene_type:complete